MDISTSVIVKADESMWSNPADIAIVFTNLKGQFDPDIMGEFKEKYNEVFERYVGICKRNAMYSGTILHIPTKDNEKARYIKPVFVENENEIKYITIIPIKEKSSTPIIFDYIVEGVKKLVFDLNREAFGRRISTIAFPKIDEKLSDTSWEKIKSAILKCLEEINYDDIIIYFYE